MTKQLASDSSHAWFMLMTLHESAWWLTKSHLWVIKYDAPSVCHWFGAVQLDARRWNVVPIGGPIRVWTGFCVIWDWSCLNLGYLRPIWSRTSLIWDWSGFQKAFPDQYLQVDMSDAVIEYQFLKYLNCESPHSDYVWSVNSLPLHSKMHWTAI